MSQLVTAIDIGHSHVRALCVRLQGSACTIVESAEVPRFTIQDGQRSIAVALSELRERCRLRGTVVVGCSDIPILVRFLSSVPMAPDRMQRLIRLELHQHCDEHGDLAADTFIVPVAGDEVIHCCTVAQVPAVQALLGELRSARIQAQHISPQVCALGYTLPLAEPIDEDEYGLVVDIGAKRTRVVLHQGQAMLAAREIPFGGDHFSEAIAKGSSIDFLRAETLKIAGNFVIGDEKVVRKQSPSDGDDDLNWLEQRLDEPAAAAPIAPAAEHNDSDDLFADMGTDGEPSPAKPTAETGDTAAADSLALWQRPEQAAQTAAADLAEPGAQTVLIARQSLGPELTQAAEQLAGHISSSLNWFRSQLKIARCRPHICRISGGGSEAATLMTYLGRRLSMQVEAYHAFARCSGAIPDSRAHTYATALGLAVQAARPLDIRPESAQRAAIWQQQLSWLWAAAVALLVLGVILVSGRVWNQRWYAEETNRYRGQQQDYDSATRTLAALGQRRDALALDVRGIAARIFAGRDLLFVIRALKEAAEVHQELWVAEFRTDAIASDSAPQEATMPGVRGARGRTATSSERATTAHADTSIDRGQLYVRVVIRRESGRDAQRYERIFRDWLNGVMTWQRPDNGQTLFLDYQQTEVPALADRHEYEVRFDFRPTQLDGTASHAHGGEP